MKTKKRSKSMKLILCMHAILLLLIIMYMTRKSENNFYLPSIITLPTLHLIDVAFRKQLITERLASYSQFYNNSLGICNMKNSLNAEQEKNFPLISKLLVKLRQQIAAYPNQYFNGRGIILTVGSSQLKLTRVNLKMIELSHTRLPVQVTI